MRSALSGNISSGRTFVKTDGYELNYLFPAQPSTPPPDTIENAIFANLTKKSNHLKVRSMQRSGTEG